MENEFTYAAHCAHLNEHKLLGNRDKATGEVFLPARPINPETHSSDMEWVELSGEGVLQAYTIVYIATTAMIEAGYDRKNPYCVGIVKTAEGPMISAFISGVDAMHPESIKIGTPMRAHFIDRGEGEARKSFLAFEPVA